jgi:eukaryotic-like serine/threonine-protein kinase
LYYYYKKGEMMLLEGQQCSHYCLIQLLKQGGMGQVYRAEDMLLPRQVAIKVIRADSAHSSDRAAMEDAVRLFIREARAIAQLDHNNILSLYDSGEEQINGIKVMYMVMPLRHEGSFADWLKKYMVGDDTLPLAGVERVVGQAAAALQYVHDRGIIHKDVKPSNFLVREYAKDISHLNLELADFGIAKVMKLSTESKIIRGTPLYMAPEQWDGDTVPATDQYALAIMAYELLTGYHPFCKQGQQQKQLYYQHISMQPAAPSMLNAALSHDIDTVILRALEKDPQHRFPSISAFAHAFRDVVLDSGNVHQSLPLNELEARRGTNRIVILSDGRQVTVPISAGAYEGQSIRMEGFGNPTTYDGPKGALILTIRLLVIEKPLPVIEKPLPSSVDPGAKTELIPLPIKKEGKRLPPSPTLGGTLIDQTRWKSSAKAWMFIVLCCVVLFSGSFYYVTTHVSGKSPVTTSTVPYPSYLHGHGQLALYDPLTDDRKGYQWLSTGLSKLPPANGNCAFRKGGFDVSVNGDANHKIYFHPCIANNTNFSNFAYEVNMKILEGDCGGLTFRGNGDAFYYFIVCQDGHYRFVKYTNDQTPAVILKDAISPSIIMMLNADNSIALKADGTTMSLYLNERLIDNIQASSYHSGQIGILVRSQELNVLTEAVFSNVHLWKLT